MGEHDHSQGVSRCPECQNQARQHLERTDVDYEVWDREAALGRCAAASNPASAYAAVCAGRRSGDPRLSSAWEFPHHATIEGPPNKNAVARGLAAVDKLPGLTNRSAARRHLEGHMRAIEAAERAAQEGEVSGAPAPPEGSEEPSHDTIHALVEMGAREEAGQSVGHACVEPCRPRSKDNLYRATFPGVELRASAPAGDAGVDTPKAAPEPGFTGDELTGHFAVFDQWTEIDSMFEGRFMESVSPGAFSKTLKENRDHIRCLFQHGRDYRIGDKPLGPIVDLREDDVGAAYTVKLLDTAYNHELIPGLREGLYGASFRFRVTREDVNEKPGKSARNPEGIPERTIREMELKEFGPVTWPAYKGASAGVRSITDEMVVGDFARDPERFRGLLGSLGLIERDGRDGTPVRDAPANSTDNSTASGNGKGGNDLPELVVHKNPNRRKRHTR